MNLEEQINFEVFKVLLEAKSGFRFEDFKAIADEDFTNPRYAQDKRLMYARTHLKQLGRGGSRFVFLLSNRFVLKLASTSEFDYAFGKSQNQNEVDVFTNPKVAPIITKVYQAGPKYNWIVSELVRPLKDKEEFESLAGVPFGVFTDILSTLEFTKISSVSDGVAEIKDSIDGYKKDLDLIKSLEPERQKEAREETMTLIGRYQAMLENLNYPIVLATLNLMSEGKVVAADLRRIEHWGKTADGRVVVLDYGYLG